MDHPSIVEALNIPLVLRTVLNNLDTHSLKECRLVNSTWNYEVCNILRDRVVVGLFASIHLKRFNYLMEYGIDNPDIAVVYQNLYLPSSLFTSVVGHLDGNLLELQSDLRRCVQLTGSQIIQLRFTVFPILPVVGNREQPYTNIMFTEALEMIYNDFPNLQDLRLLFIVGPPSVEMESLAEDKKFDYQRILQRYKEKQVHNLKSLQIDIEILRPQTSQQSFACFDDHDGPAVELKLEEKMIAGFLQTLIASAINLQVISCQNNHPEALLQQCLLKSLPSNCARLRQLHVPMLMSSESLRSFCTSSFPNLNTAHLEVNTDKVTMSDLTLFFCRYHLSLQRLHLALSESGSHFSTAQLPLGNYSMLRLTCLILELFEGSLDWKKLPVLKTVTLKHCSFQGIASSLSSSPPACWHRLESLKIVENFSDQEEAFKILFTEIAPYRIFSNLQDLTITCLSYTLPLPVIFRECKQLQRFSVRKCEGVTDEVLCGFTGFSPVVDSDSSDSSTLAILQPSRQFPFIGDLQAMHSLTLEGEFSVAFIIKGVQYCNRLQELHLYSDKLCGKHIDLINQLLLNLTNASLNGVKFI